MVTMNKDKYENLPDDLKQVLDKNSRMALANKVGEVFDKHDQMAIQAAKDKGDEIVEIPDPLKNDQIGKVRSKEEQKKYLKDVNALGLDADSVYEKAKAASAACKV